MTQPRICKRGSGCIRVALLAFHQEVVLERNPGIRIIYFNNVMDPMAVGADRFVRRLIGEIFFEHFHGCPVEISYIGVQHVRRKSVLLHERFIRVTFGAEERNAISERIRRGAVNVMYTVTVNARGNILIAFLGESCAVDALPIVFIDRAMTLCAGLGYSNPCTR